MSAYDYSQPEPLWLGKWKMPPGWTRPTPVGEISGCHLTQDEIEALWEQFSELRSFPESCKVAARLVPVESRSEGHEAPPCGKCEGPRTWEGPELTAFCSACG